MRRARFLPVLCACVSLLGSACWRSPADAKPTPPIRIPFTTERGEAFQRVVDELARRGAILELKDPDSGTVKSSWVVVSTERIGLGGIGKMERALRFTVVIGADGVCVVTADSANRVWGVDHWEEWRSEAGLTDDESVYRTQFAEAVRSALSAPAP